MPFHLFCRYMFAMTTNSNDIVPQRYVTLLCYRRLLGALSSIKFKCQNCKNGCYHTKLSKS